MTGKKIFLIVLILVVVGGGIVAGTIWSGHSNVPAVTTAKAATGDLISTVSGTGQIRPKTFVNVGATSFGRITHLFVKEGDQKSVAPRKRHVSVIQSGVVLVREGAATATHEARRVVASGIREVLRENVTRLKLKAT